MKLSKHQLRRVLRKVIKEHVTDEHHEHPHAEPHRQLPQTSNKSEAEDLLHDTLLNWCLDNFILFPSHDRWAHGRSIWASKEISTFEI